MKRKLNYFLGALLIAIIIAWFYSNTQNQEEDFAEVVKVSLRNVGNELLLANSDSTSLVSPVKRIEHNKFQLSFKNNLSINPGEIVENIKASFQKSELSKYYRVEVIQCEDQEVAYSYEVKNESENDIIPCKSRELPNECYIIEVKFTEAKQSIISKEILLALFFITAFALLFSIFYKRNSIEGLEEKSTPFEALGSFQFYPEQNKLVKKAIEINLSKKECELLEILVANSNQIVKRDELTKRIWEDNGVIVGRSLDTYISKLRKKLKDDESIKITNVHGVGYKLEINK